MLRTFELFSPLNVIETNVKRFAAREYSAIRPVRRGFSDVQCRNVTGNRLFLKPPGVFVYSRYLFVRAIVPLVSFRIREIVRASRTDFVRCPIHAILAAVITQYEIPRYSNEIGIDSHPSPVNVR